MELDNFDKVKEMGFDKIVFMYIVQRKERKKILRIKKKKIKMQSVLNILIWLHFSPCV